MISKTTIPTISGHAAVLGAPPSQRVTLGVGQEKRVAWDAASQDERYAGGLELRVHYAGFRGLALQAPRATWQLRFGHGTASFRVPPAFQRGNLNQDGRYIVPHRGLVWRVSAREAEVTVKFAESVGATGSIDLDVSFQPVVGTCCIAPPLQHDPRGFSQAVPEWEIFPAEASEWRVRLPDGSKPTVGDIPIRDISGNIGVDVAAADVADWSPISPLAAFYFPGTSYIVAFR